MYTYDIHMYTWVCLHHICFWCLAKKRLFKRSNSKRHFFSTPKTVILMLVAATWPYLAFTCLNFFPLRPRSSSNILRFLCFTLWNQHHCLLLQAGNPQLPSKKMWKGVISQPKGVTTPKGVFSSGVILRVFRIISFRQPASQMGVQLFGCWLLEYYVSFFFVFLNMNLHHIARIAAGQRGSKKTSPIKWNAFVCLKRLVLRRQFFGPFKKPFFYYGLI